MAFWNKANNSPDPEADLSRQSLERGGLPLLATRRIEREVAAPSRHFTSDLSVNELALTHATGYLPVSQVMGSSVYHVGWQYTPYYSSGELQIMTHAYAHARQLALTRLQTEARMLGANGVVGVRIDQRRYDWGADLIEFSALGTAIRLPGAPPSEHPFLSDLSGQEFWQLHVAGFRPAGIVFGNCVWYEVASWSTQMANNQQGAWLGTTSWYNQELTDFTQAVFNARHLAMHRMEDECRSVSGEGIVGVKIATDVSEYEVELGNDRRRTDLIVTFEALGTAIAHAGSLTDHTIDYAVPLSSV